jgi:uncharacterized protein YhaN
MRILELKLDAFGPFTQVELDLSGGHEGLHLVYGPNEAGKTSALRAIRQLFFGIPLRSTDDFVHPMKSLRLGGTLRRSDGELLEFVRLKRTKNPLVNADGTTPLEQARLDRFLGGVDQSLFSSLFGIDHETLVRGGQEIVEGGGSLNNVLFAASSGIANLRGIQQQLHEKAEELFKSGGRVQRIPRAVAEFREANLRLKELQVPGDRWARHDQALRAAQERQGVLETRWREKEGESSRLRRIRTALPLFSERSHLVGELAECHDAVILAENFPDSRRKAQAELAAAEHEIQRAKRSLDELNERREAIALPTTLLALDQEVEALRDARGEQRKAQEDRPKRERDLQEKEHAARDILQSLGKERDLEIAESLRLRVDEPARIAQLARRFTELTTRRSEARALALKHGDRLGKLRRELESLGPPEDLSRLRATLQAVQREGNVEEQLARVATQLAPLERDLATALRRLPGWSGSLEDLEGLTVPLPETVTRHETEIQDAETAVRDLVRARSQESEAIDDIESKLRGQSLELEIPSEDDLRDARRRRDAGWTLVRAAWIEGRDDPAARAELGASFSDPGSLAEAYQQAVAGADHLADRLRREARSVAAKAEWLAQLQRSQAALQRVSQELAAGTARCDRVREEWNALLSSLRLQPMKPDELRSWLGLREKVLTQHRHVRDLRAERDRLDRLIEAHCDRLAGALPSIDSPQAVESPTLSSLVEAASSLVGRRDATDRKADKLDAQIAAEQSSLDAARQQIELAESELEAWRVPWAESMSRIGLGHDATPEQASIFQAEIAKLFQLLEEAAGFRSRIKGIDRDAGQFEVEARDLARRTAPELTERPAAEIADMLWDRLRAARDDVQKHGALTERIQSEGRALDKAERARTAALLEIEGLCRDAGVPVESELPAAEQRSARRVRIETDLHRCEELIRQQSAGASVEAFAREVSASNPDTLGIAIEDIEAELKEMQQELRDVNQAIGSESTQLSQMDGSSKAAEASEAAGLALGQLLEDVPRFAVLRLASKVLQRGIERYRDRNQGPVLARASTIFAGLTGGSFEGLRVETDDQDQSVIVGVRPGGQQCLGAEAMSTGACDQLYLAIRIAYLEHWLEGREPMPFIVDDILLSFDNGRAMAALKVLGELSKKTQVIFFTHHAHLLELARSCLSKDVLFPQLLPSGALL